MLWTDSATRSIFAIICNGGIKTQNKIIAALREKVGDSSLCDALEKHVYGPFDKRAEIRNRSSLSLARLLTSPPDQSPATEEEGEDILLTIIGEYVSERAYKMVSKWHKDYVKRGLTSDKPFDQDTDGTDAGQYQALKNLLAFVGSRDVSYSMLIRETGPTAASGIAKRS